MRGQSVEERGNRLLQPAKLGFAIPRAFVYDLSCLIYKQGPGDILSGKQTEYLPPFVGQHGKCELMVIFKPGHLFPSFLSPEDEQRKPWIVPVLFPDIFMQHGQLRIAGRAPGGKEVDDQYFIPVVCDMCGFSLFQFKTEVGDDLPDFDKGRTIRGEATLGANQGRDYDKRG